MKKLIAIASILDRINIARIGQQVLQRLSGRTHAPTGTHHDRASLVWSSRRIRHSLLIGGQHGPWK